MRIGRFNDAAKSMIDELFRYEEHDQFQTTTMSVKCNTSTAAMLTVISELFGDSRYAFAGSILDDFIVDLFLNLPVDKRAQIAVKADEIETEILAKQGVTVESMGSAGSINGTQTWRMLMAINERKEVQESQVEGV